MERHLKISCRKTTIKNPTRIFKIRTLSTLVLAAVIAAPAWARPIDDVLKNAHRRDKVLIEGKIVKPFDFDTLLVSDDSGDVAVSFTGLQQRLGAGDSVVVYGRFDGRRSYAARYGLINAIDWALSSDPKAANLKGRDAEEAEPAPAPAAPSTPDNRTIEFRLKELKRALKTAKLSAAAPAAAP